MKFKNRLITNALMTSGIFLAPLILSLIGGEVKRIWLNVIMYVVLNVVLGILFWKAKV